MQYKDYKRFTEWLKLFKINNNLPLNKTTFSSKDSCYKPQMFGTCMLSELYKTNNN